MVPVRFRILSNPVLTTNLFVSSVKVARSAPIQIYFNSVSDHTESVNSRLRRSGQRMRPNQFYISIVDVRSVQRMRPNQIRLVLDLRKGQFCGCVSINSCISVGCEVEEDLTNPILSILSGQDLTTTNRHRSMENARSGSDHNQSVVSQRISIQDRDATQPTAIGQLRAVALVCGPARAHTPFRLSQMRRRRRTRFVPSVVSIHAS